MTDNIAVLDGYTVHVSASSSAVDLDLLVRPETDFDGTFRAWDTDAQEFIRVNGWLFAFDFNECEDDGQPDEAQEWRDYDPDC